MEVFVYKENKKLRCGYTTGTCAALAAKAAVRALFTGVRAPKEEIQTPKGQNIQVEIEGWSQGDGFAECAVRKDGGDDSDVTDGLLVFVRAEFLESGPPVTITGGPGVGRVTKAGLDQPVGEWAINSVPRRMMTEAVETLLEEAEEKRPVRLTVRVPGGEAAAEKTFNPLLGIEGGISILGTSGIVEPMSEEALVDTIRARMKVLRAEGRRWVVLVPGNLGAEYFRRYKEGTGDVPEEVFSSAVACSNFIGKAVDLAGELGFSGLLLAGHLGKLVKLGNGIMNTHSREADGRMDTLVSCALTAGAKRSLLFKIQGANTTDQAAGLLSEAGLLAPVSAVLLQRIDGYLKRRAMDGLLTGVFLFGPGGKFLGGTPRAEEIFKNVENECKVGEKQRT